MTHAHIAHRPLGGDSRRRAWLAVGYIPLVTAVTFGLAWRLSQGAGAARAAWELTILGVVAGMVPVFGSWSARKAISDGAHNARLAIALNVAGALLVITATIAGGVLGGFA